MSKWRVTAGSDTSVIRAERRGANASLYIAQITTRKLKFDFRRKALRSFVAMGKTDLR